MYVSLPPDKFPEKILNVIFTEIQRRVRVQQECLEQEQAMKRHLCNKKIAQASLFSKLLRTYSKYS